jgi:hypothetical protein
LIVAGVLLLLAVVAYSINDAEGNFLRREAALRGHQAVRAQVQRSTVEMKAFEEESARTIRDRAELHGQHDEIMKSLKRIEKLLEGASPPESGLSWQGGLDLPATASAAAVSP